MRKKTLYIMEIASLLEVCILAVILFPSGITLLFVTHYLALGADITQKKSLECQ